MEGVIGKVTTDVSADAAVAAVMAVAELEAGLQTAPTPAPTRPKKSGDILTCNLHIHAFKMLIIPSVVFLLFFLTLPYTYSFKKNHIGSLHKFTTTAT